MYNGMLTSVDERLKGVVGNIHIYRVFLDWSYDNYLKNVNQQKRMRRVIPLPQIHVPYITLACPLLRDVSAVSVLSCTIPATRYAIHYRGLQYTKQYGCVRRHVVRSIRTLPHCN